MKMKKNNSQSKSSDNIKRSRSEKLLNLSNGNAKKGRKIWKVNSRREIIQVVLPGTRYRNGQWIKKKTVKVMDVRVLKSASEDLEGIGNERLVLWKMSAEETEELKQQVKQEALHKKRENIMPLVMQMSNDQIETAYEGIIKQWNIPDNLHNEEYEDEYDCDENANDEENKYEKELPRNAEVFDLDTHVSLVCNISSSDIIPSSRYSMSDDKNCNMTSSTEDLKACCESKSPDEMELCCDSLGLIVLQSASMDVIDLEPSDCDKIPVVPMSFGENQATAQIKTDQITQGDFVAPLLIENSQVPELKELGDEVSEKVRDCNSEVANSKESVAESVKDKSRMDDCNSSLENLSMPLSSIPDSVVVTTDHSFTNIKTTISPAEFWFNDCLSAAANDPCNAKNSEMGHDLNLCPRPIKRKRTMKAAFAKKIKLDVSKSSCLVSESLKMENHSISLTADCASDKNSIVTTTNTFAVQKVQTVTPNEEPNLECSTLLEERMTPVSLNCSCDVQKSWDSVTKKQTKDLSVVLRRFPNKSNDPVNLEPNISAELKPREVNFLLPTLGSKSMLNVSKPDSGIKKGTNLIQHKNADGSYHRKDHKKRNCADVENKDKDLAKGCDRDLETVQKNHLNPAVEKKNNSNKAIDKTSSEEPHVNCQVMENDLHLTEDMCQNELLSSKESFNEQLKLKRVSELTVSQVKQKANTREIPSIEESKTKDVIPLDFEHKQKHSNKLSNLISEQGMVNTNSNIKEVFTGNNANLHQIQVVKDKGKKETANDLMLCQPQVSEHNNRKKNTSRKSGLCKTEVNLRCRDVAGSTTVSDLCQREIHGRNYKTKDGNQVSDLHQTEIFQIIDKKKITTKDTELCQSEIIDSSSTKKFTGKDSDHFQAEIIKSSGNKKLTAKDSGPSQTEIIESSSETKDSVLSQIEVTSVDSHRRQDPIRDLSMNQKSPKSSTLLNTVSAKSKHKKTHKRVPKELSSESCHEKDQHQEAQNQENLGDSTNFSSRNELDTNYSGHISRGPSKTELDNSNHDLTYLGKNQNDNIPCSETKNHTETDKCNVKLKTSNCDLHKDKNCCNTTVFQTEATVLSINSFPVTQKLVDHVQVHAADDLNSKSVKHNDAKNFAVSANVCSTATEEESTKVHACESLDDEQHKLHKPKNLFCQAASQPTERRDIDLKESHGPQLMAVSDSILSQNDHISSHSKSHSFAVKNDCCVPSVVLRNDCLVTRNSNFCLLDYSDSSNSELSDSGNVLSNEVINGINHNRSIEDLSPIHSPSPQSASSPTEADSRRYVNGKPLKAKEPVAIPLMVEDAKVRNLLEHMCKAEILQFLGDY